ncbi:hypothetical protein [Streptomyces sp. GESEQ-35]|uniref:hypothetical protein n=1 Tax=Streptomyces sp. GESEQ-35 TaxID=2812657 RepID=UPI001B32E9E7|nr:hypothetical protein [Streptomyces sp. GESEQ-35]
MTPWWRVLPGLVAGVVLLPCGDVSYGSVQSYGAVSSYDIQVSASASPSEEPSRAGSRAGEGRERPGRQGAAEPVEEATRATRRPQHQPTSTAPPQPVKQAAAEAESPAEPVLRILPLGSGLVLIGLGLGLALLGLRLRRR